MVLQNHRKNRWTNLLDVELANEVFLPLRELGLVHQFDAVELQFSHELCIGQLYPVVEHINLILNRLNQVIRRPTP